MQLNILHSCFFIGLRAAHESRQMQWDDIELAEDENGEYLTFRERSTKTRTGASNETRWFTPKAYQNLENELRCPVRHYKMFKARRPLAMMQKDSPFYLAVNHTNKALSNRNESTYRKWYKTSPLGPGKLSSMMKDMAKLAGFVGKYTNHSLRKTMCTNLLHAGVPPTLIQQLSGHKNVASISNYAVASKRQQREMGHILANPGLITASATNVRAPKVPRLDLPNGTPQIEESSTQVLANTTNSTNFSSSVQAGQFSGANITGCTFNLITMNQK